MVATELTEKAADTLREIWQHTDVTPEPRVAVILGSGLCRAGKEAVTAGAIATPYTDVPGMPGTGVVGHAGRFVADGSGSPNTVLLQGRSHLYEGWTVDEATFPVRVLAALGVETLVVTNAAGGIRRGMQPGDLMLIEDHLSFADLSNLAEPASTPVYHRPTPAVWDAHLLEVANGVPGPLTIHRGCYAMMPGPNYETPAEVRMLRTMGADAVGMSTVPEAIVARRLGMSVLGISCVTNAAAGLTAAQLTHEDVTQTAASIESEFVNWLWQLLARL